MRLIITADYLGRNTQVKAVIFDLMGRGLVTSATIMPVVRPWRSVMTGSLLIRPAPFRFILISTEFQPLTSSTLLAELLDHQGNFTLANYRRARPGAGLEKRHFSEVVDTVTAALFLWPESQPYRLSP